MAVLLEVRTAFASAEDATSAARTLVSEHLAACAQIVPGVTSIYVWQDMLRHESEALLILKTMQENWPALRDRLAELHPYETPEIIGVPVEHASFDYLAWVKDSLR
jgi:periplasmic divalent cation tolerance protein